MPNFIVAGCGTNVGKTVVAAILTKLFDGVYWKPIECGESDTVTLQRLKQRVYPPKYRLKAPLSPHHAARLENRIIDVNDFKMPEVERPLIIESVGGVLVPLTRNVLSLALFKQWQCQWIIVSKHYLGSINHTLLSLQALKQHRVSIAGIIFNGTPNLDSESAILEIGKIPLLGRILPEKTINMQTIQKYAIQWKPFL